MSVNLGPNIDDYQAQLFVRNNVNDITKLLPGQMSAFWKRLTKEQKKSLAAWDGTARNSLVDQVVRAAVTVAVLRKWPTYDWTTFKNTYPTQAAKPDAHKNLRAELLRVVQATDKHFRAAWRDRKGLVGSIFSLAKKAGGLFEDEGRPSSDAHEPETLAEAMAVLDEADGMTDDQAWTQGLDGLLRARRAWLEKGKPPTGGRAAWKVGLRPPKPGRLSPLNKPQPAKGTSGEADGETGWHTAARRLAGQALGAPAPARAHSHEAARRGIQSAAAPAFAAGLDSAASADLILRVAKAQGGAPDLARLRQSYIASAAQHFAAEFVRTISSAPRGTSENLALGAIIASALAQTGQRFPLVAPAAVSAMAVLIHKRLQPQLPALARMAATAATASVTPRPGAVLRELAW